MYKKMASEKKSAGLAGDGGNAETPSPNAKKRDSTCCSWTFRLSNPEQKGFPPGQDGLQGFMDLLIDNNVSCAAGGYEVGDETGHPHYQGVAHWEHGKTKKFILRICKETHWEMAHDWRCIKNYVIKEDKKRIAGPIYYNMGPIHHVPGQLDGITPYPWQQGILDLMKKDPHPRKIYWIYDREGASGKTALADQICSLYPGRTLYVEGKASDVKYGVTQLVSKNPKPLAFLFDFVRSKEKFVSYEAIEAVKNGIFYSTKYESGMVRYHRPHVICFANYLPDGNALSQDRWSIQEIVNKHFTTFYE